MHIQHTAEVLRVHSKRGTENTHAALILQLGIRLDRIAAEDRGVLMGYTGEQIQITLRAEDIVDPAAPRPMEKLWTDQDPEERMRPGPTENCSECGKVIGEDPDADFYAPLAGPTRPVCGACKLAIEDAADAEDAEAEAASSESSAADEAPASQTNEHIRDNLEAATTREAQPGDWLDIAERGDEALGDGPMPERPDELEPVASPTRRRR